MLKAIGVLVLSIIASFVLASAIKYAVDLFKPPVDMYIADLQEQIDLLNDRIEILENN